MIAPAPLPKKPWRTPDWLQVFVILGLLGAAIFVATEERYLWCLLLAIADVAFGLSFVLRRMVGDEYGRT